ncbi:tripartite tricarboxylate transporter substrate binding protein [Pigmentiphaga soli]|uniref:Tripartite tricarboxylate transporter substrate binding protein n=1 Tax=Pigmentiphaga soli TaxID=1007095 RepID=A0ABP8GNQ2_9BURK
MKTGIVARSLLALGLGSAAALAHAAYPDKPLHLIVPYPPGGNIDATARIVANGLSAELGQTVVIENRAGASGMLGAEVVARSAPDGYTMLLASSGALAPVKAINPSMKLDPDKDFAAAGSIARAPLMLVVGPSVPSRNVKEFIAYAKARPGKLTMASAGTGGNGHLTGELFQSMSGTRFLHVPYKGGGQAMADLIGGQTDLTFVQPASALSQMASGKLRALGVTTLKRSSVVPDVPTLDESGLPGFEASTTTGLLFPAGTPKDVLGKVNAALVKVLKMPDTRKQFEQLGSDVMEGSEDFSRIVSLEITQWSKVIRDADLKMP